MQPPKILFVPSVQEVDTSERTPTILRLLRKRHEIVGLVAPWDREVYDPTHPRPARYAKYVLGQMRSAVRGLRLARSRGVGLVFCETPHHALVGLGIARLRGIACVWDSHGNALRYARSMQRGRAYTFLAASLDRFLARHVDLLITVSRKDAEAYEAMGARASRIEVIPTCVDLPRVDRQIAGIPRGPRPEGMTPSKKILVFFGNFSYTPNVEALRFIVEQVAPFLRKADVPCEIQVAGRDLPSTPVDPSVNPIGFVKDLYMWIRRSDLCIVPVWRGVGILTKVLDAMAAGTPVVASGLVVDGIPEIRDGVHAVVASGPKEFADGVMFALNHPAVMEEMAARSRALIEERYDWKIHEPRLEEALARLVRSPQEA